MMSKSTRVTVSDLQTTLSAEDPQISTTVLASLMLGVSPKRKALIPKVISAETPMESFSLFRWLLKAMGTLY